MDSPPPGPVVFLCIVITSDGSQWWEYYQLRKTYSTYIMNHHVTNTMWIFCGCCWWLILLGKLRFRMHILIYCKFSSLEFRSESFRSCDMILGASPECLSVLNNSLWRGSVSGSFHEVVTFEYVTWSRLTDDPATSNCQVLGWSMLDLVYGLVYLLLLSPLLLLTLVMFSYVLTFSW